MADITLPQLGETVTEGTITRWFKKVGDLVVADEPLFEVSTDKVDTEVPSPSAGTLLEIRVPEGDTVAVGTVIAVVGDSDAAPTAPAPAAAAPEPTPVVAPVVAVATPPVPAAPAAPPVTPSTQAAPAAPPVTPSTQAAPAAPSAAEPAASVDNAPPTPATSESTNENRLLSPVVRRLVSEHGLDPATLVGTGAGGRITREDVLDQIDKIATAGARSTTATSAQTLAQPVAQAAPVAAAPAVQTAPVAAAPPVAAMAPITAAAPAVHAGERDQVVQLSKIRKLTGAHMIMSKGVSPHAFSVVEVDFANVDTTRNKVKNEWKVTEGFGLTYLGFIARAVVDALVDFPHLNASVDGDNLVVHSFVDLGIAVDLDFTGLLVPVVRNAETKRLRAIAREINDLAGRARSRKLSPDEISGGTFTISNNGSAGSVLTMPIINQPQVAILSTDAIVRKPVVVKLADGGEGIAIHPVGNLAMSWDHRAFDGAYAAGFLVRIKELVETRDWSAEL